MSLTIRDTVSRAAHAARDFTRDFTRDFASDIATALHWLEAAKRDLRGARADGGAGAARAGR